MYDVVIIGAGVSGCAIARELSRYQIDVCVLEKMEDVCSQTSKANSGIVHAGHDARCGTLKARLNVRGNEMMEEFCKELDVPFLRNGSLVVCTDEADRPKLLALLENGKKNGVSGLKILEKEEVKAMEPNISDQTVAALYAPSGGIVCPFELNIAMAENAFANGVKFEFCTEVTDIKREKEGYLLKTDACGEEKEYKAKIVVNAAGVHADELHNMVGNEKLNIVPRRGEYFLLDKLAGEHVSATIFALPGIYGKGVLVTPTVHGNLLVGPTAIDSEEKEGTETTREGLDLVREQSSRTVKDIPLHQVITSFAGLRANEKGHDFVIEETEPGFIDCAGIASPGLSSCPAIGEMVAQMIREKYHFMQKDDFTGKRNGILHPDSLPEEERNQLIEENPDYAAIVCRCEMITEGEIRDAIRRPLGARTMDGIKRRTRAGMGRCQSGFCSPRVMEILAEELGEDLLEVTKSGRGSKMLTGRIKEEL